MDAVIDTGFTDFLTLPPMLTILLGLPITNSLQVTLADGGFALLDAYQAVVTWDGQEKDIIVLETDGGPLVGMSLLEGSRITVEIVAGARVTIETIP